MNEFGSVTFTSDVEVGLNTLYHNVIFVITLLLAQMFWFIIINRFVGHWIHLFLQGSHMLQHFAFMVSKSWVDSCVQPNFVSHVSPVGKNYWTAINISTTYSFIFTAFPQIIGFFQIARVSSLYSVLIVRIVESIALPMTKLMRRQFPRSC